MKVASIKGVALQPIVQLTLDLLESGRISPNQLQLKLEQPDLRLLDEKLEPSLWYPIAPAARIETFVAEVLGRDEAEMMREIGVEAAQRTLNQTAMRNLVEGARQHGERMGHIVASLGKLLVNFGEWRFEGDPYGEFRLDATDVEPFPETTRYATEGFIEVLARQLTGRSAVVSSRRPDPAHIIFDGRIEY